MAAATLIPTPTSVLVLRAGRQTEVALADPLNATFASSDSTDAAVRAPMHGRLVALLVKPGDTVAKGQRLAIVEAMKMEHALTAPRSGIVSETHGREGEQVAQGAALVVLGVMEG